MQTAFERFVDDNARSLLGSAYLLTGDTHAAEDLVQDALERVFVHWARIQDPLPYTRTVMARRVTDRWRAAGRRPRQLPLDLHEHDVALPDPALDHVEHSDMAALLRYLPARQRAVIVLRYFEDRSEAEIAEALGCSAGTVKSQASKALRTLRRTHAADDEQTRQPTPRGTT